MNIFQKITITGLVALSSCLNSCNYLNVDEYFYDDIPLDTIFAKREYLERYLWNAASYLPNEGNLYGDSYGPYMTSSDEVQLSWKKAEYNGTYLSCDEITPFTDAYNQWGTYYKGIRKANMILTNIDKCKDLTQLDRREILGLTYFLRGYLYFFLVQQYGPVPILPDEPMNTNAPIEKLAYARNTYDECVDYICQNLQQAYEYLEESRPSSEFTRPTKYAAQAIISRIRLRQASPWYNGNSFYSSWKTTNGHNFIAQTYDEKKWALSAMASKLIIASGRYELHTISAYDNTPAITHAWKADYPNGAGGIDPYHSYADMFNGEALAVKNNEIIYPANITGNVTSIVFPLDLGGWNGLGVTQELVEAYYAADGTNKNMQASGYYEPIGAAKTWSGEDNNRYTLRGEAPQMYDHMEPRFYATIGFCECLWPGLSANQQGGASYRNYHTEYYSNGNCAPRSSNPEDYNLTGYTCKKYVHWEDNYRGDFQGVIKPKFFPAIRYAEILLNYAEALNELNNNYSETLKDGQVITVSRDWEAIRNSFNLIRFRAGLPGLDTDPGQEEFRKIVRRERQIELAHEGFRYHDIRRYGILEETMSKPCRGMDVTKRKQERAQFFTPVRLTHKYAKRVYSPKMYFWPIKRSVLDQNPKLIQNPLW